MFSRRLKTGYFILEGLNSFAVVYYFYYFYFFMQKAFGFDNKANLALAALNGGTYAIFAWWGGKFAQRFGYFTALKLGFGLMMSALAAGLLVASAPGQIIVMLVTVIGMCFTWPTLEALVSEGEPRAGLQHMVGIYNVVWAGTAAVANFTGGAMLDHLGSQSLFYVPITIQLTQLSLTFWLESQARRSLKQPTVGQASSLSPIAGQLTSASRSDAALGLDAGEEPVSAGGTTTVLSPATATLLASPVAAQEASPHPAANAKKFLHMAWLANPFAYVAINTLIAVIPGVAGRLGLSTMLAGFCCSVWCFARLGAFFGLWFWNGWHYRFRWLLLAYLALIGAFATILLIPNLAALVAAQIIFGGAIGLIYYSSLFYSMDISETKGEHGGIHEAAIGLGNFAGPAVGAAALQFLPHHSNSGALAVSVLLLGGLAGLGTIWRSGRELTAKTGRREEQRQKEECRM